MKNKKSKIAIVILIISILIGIVSGSYLVYKHNRLNDYNTAISQIKDKTTDEDKKSISKKKLNFKSLKKINSDVKGWLSIPNTYIDTPVTQTKNNTFYLKHNFYKNYSFYGNAFLDYQCNDKSHLKIIYGHNMRDNAQFGTLHDLYKNPNKAKSNSMITYETSSGKSEWIVVGAYYTNGTEFAQTSEQLRNALDSNSVNSIENKTKQLDKLKNKFIYTSDVIFDEYDNYMELYTCSYQVKGQRFVVVAREKRENELITNIDYKK